jgi:hypothetical protein
MPKGKLYPLTCQPGIKRDGTQFASRFFINGQWCRFQRGLPRKMGGYKQLIGGLPNKPTGIFVVPKTPNFDVYIGDSSSLKYFTIDQFGNALTGLIDRTPVGFVANANNIWSFDQMYDTNTNQNIIIAHAAPNASFIGNNVSTPVYYGNVYDNAPFVPNGQMVSGGIAVFPPYLFMFGNTGQVIISNKNDPTTVFNEAFIASQKIVVGMPMRGGNSSPAGLLWSLDSLIRVTAVNTNAGLEFKFDTVTNQSSILSSRSVVEYDGLYFWAGIDRFLVYNGVVQEVPNQMNLNYFFYNNPMTGTGLNYPFRQNVWATKVPQFGEVWFHFPTGASTESDDVVIFNKRENSWYDTSIARGAGYFEQVFADPIWADSLPSGGTYAIWQHESGIDKNVGGILTAIDSFIQSGDVSWAAIDPAGGWTGVDRWVDLYRFEPDMLQTGNMTLTVNTKSYANSVVVSSNPYTFTPNTTKIDLREQGREMTLTFESNAIGGFYEINQILLTYRTGDARASGQ